MCEVSKNIMGNSIKLLRLEEERKNIELSLQNSQSKDAVVINGKGKRKRKNTVTHMI